MTAFTKDLPSLGGATAVTNMVTLTEAVAAAMGVSALALFVVLRGIRPSIVLSLLSVVLLYPKGISVKPICYRSSSPMLFKNLLYRMVVALGILL